MTKAVKRTTPENFFFQRTLVVKPTRWVTFGTKWYKMVQNGEILKNSFSRNSLCEYHEGYDAQISPVKTHYPTLQNAHPPGSRCVYILLPWPHQVGILSLTLNFGQFSKISKISKISNFRPKILTESRFQEIQFAFVCTYLEVLKRFLKKK